MKKIILAPDSFKGTLSADEVCAIVKAEIEKLDPSAEVISIPMSDGGEGMVFSYLRSFGGEERSALVCGPEGTPVSCPYGILPDGTAVVEMAGCAGLPQMIHGLDPLGATTRGLGELLRLLESEGVKKVLLGLGGSATNDCGIGMAGALGWIFLDKDNNKLEPYAYNLDKVEKIVPPKHPLTLQITAACDVKNPLCGPDGAAAVFGPQKGLKIEQILPHDEAMSHFADVIRRELGSDVKDLPGAGAAGGLGAGVTAFCDAVLKPGISMLLDAAHFDDLIKNADLVITGEGRLDWQSAEGKVPSGVGERCALSGVLCIALCGCLGRDAQKILGHGVSEYYPASEPGRSMEELKKTCRGDLSSLAARVLKPYLQ